MGRCIGRYVALSCVCFALCASALCALRAETAGAATTGSAYGYVGSFGDAQLTASGLETNSVVVDPASGNIVVSDLGTGAAQVFAPDPFLGGTWLTSLAPSYGPPIAAAIDPSNGALFVVSVDGAAHRYVSDGLPTPTYTEDMSFAMAPGSIADIAGAELAVDPGTHELLATDSGVVKRFSPTGALVSTFNGADTVAGPLTFPHGIAVGPNGDVYVIDTVGLGRVERFNRAGTSLGRVATGGFPVVAAVNQATGELLVGEDLVPGTKRPFIEGFTAGGTRTFTARYPVADVGALNRGLAVNSATGRIYAGVEVGGVGTVNVFDNTLQPGVDPPQVSQIGATSAHLSAAVATGGVSTDANFEYCPATVQCGDFQFSDSNDPANPWQVLGPPTTLPGDDTLEADLTGLDPNKGYLVRTYATNGSTENVSASTRFATVVAPAIAVTGNASEIHPTDAVLNGTVDPRGAQTTYYFQYGATTDYGARTPQSVDGIAGDGRKARSFSRTVDGLTPGATYHFRLVAHNDAGTTFGADQTFTAAAATQPARGYEQVSPANKAGATLWSAYGFDAKADGTALEYALTSAPAGAPSSTLIPRAMSRRGASDWLDEGVLDPPLGVGRQIRGTVTQAVSSDFTHVFVATNRKLTSDATEGAGNVYVKDLDTNTYSFVGGSSAPDATNSIIGLNKASTFIAGAPDFSWVVLATTVPLLPGAPDGALYRWTAGQGLTLLSVLPDGTAPTGDIVQEEQRQAPVHYVSDDGSVAAFALATGEVGVYRRAGGQTTALSVSRIGGAPPTPLAGRVDGISRDGDTVVFRSGRLLPEAPAGETSLYRYRASSNSLTYIGTLIPNADPQTVMGVADDGNTVYYWDGTNTVAWHDGATHAVTPVYLPDAVAFTSSNGRFLVWVGADGDVHRYDVLADATACASCRADGSPGGHALITDATRNISNQRPLVVTDTGKVYFTTTDRLVTADRNGSRDVYSYDDGRPTLISPGTGEFDANYADASESGDDVFFTTTQGIVGQDVDGAVDIYDARIGGGFPGQSPLSPAPCQKSDCGPTSSGPVTSPPVVAQPQPPGPPKARTNQAKPKVGLRKVTFTAKAMHITFSASQRGRVRVTGSRVATTVRNVSKSGTYSMTVSLSKKARSLKRSHRRFKVTAKLVLSGGWGTASTKINRTLRG